MAMNRREALQITALGLAGGWSSQARRAAAQSTTRPGSRRPAQELAADVIIIGAGLGGCAAALAALRNGLSVVLTDPTDWIGGQLTSQGVPPDEHRFIETHGANASYRKLRDGVREYYRQHYPLTQAARENPHLNPGAGRVSRICHEPRIAVAVVEAMLAPYCSGGQCTLLLEHEPVAADVDGDAVRAVQVRSLRSGRELTLRAPYFIDASELGDLLPLTNTEFVMGAESRAETNELHALEQADPLNQQAFTVCFAMDYRPGEEHVIDRPDEYEFWRHYTPQLTPPWPGKLLNLSYTSPASGNPRELAFDPELNPTESLNLFLYRQIGSVSTFEPGAFGANITLVNWPQNDYLLGPLIGVSAEQAAEHVRRAKQLSLSLAYWLQTEVPRPDGGAGWPGLRLRTDVMGTEDGMAKYPYVRESRRLRALFTILEEHVGRDQRAMVTGQPRMQVKSAEFPDSVGVGSYHIDLHPSTGGNNYIDFSSLPFQIPLGALIPQRVSNLLAANKNIGTTHITNGCYRLHPVEWGIGEAAGCLVSHVLHKKSTPHAVHQSASLLADFQADIRRQGVETHWPD